MAAADLPGEPASPGLQPDVGIGLLVGLLGGVLLTFIRDRVDGRLRGRDDLAARLDRQS